MACSPRGLRGTTAAAGGGGPRGSRRSPLLRRSRRGRRRRGWRREPDPARRRRASAGPRYARAPRREARRPWIRCARRARRPPPWKRCPPCARPASRSAGPVAIAAGFRVPLPRLPWPVSLVLPGSGTAPREDCREVSGVTRSGDKGREEAPRVWRGAGLGKTHLVDWLVSGNSALCRFTSLSVALLLTWSA